MPATKKGERGEWDHAMGRIIERLCLSKCSGSLQLMALGRLPDKALIQVSPSNSSIGEPIDCL